MLDTDFIAMPQILESGITLVSPHVRWIIRHAVLEHCHCDAINQIAYCKDIPKNPDPDPTAKLVWGEAYSPGRVMALNLEQHFHSSLVTVMDPENMNTSIRLFILRELIDTAIHESHHLKVSYETGDFNNSTLEEEQAKGFGWNKSWMAAKFWDVDIKNFGKVLDTMLEEWVETLREDCKNKKVVMWKELQLYMWDNNLTFYDPAKDRTVSMREAFEAMAKDPHTWHEDPKPFMVEDIEEAQEDLEQTEVNYVVPPEVPNPPDNSAPEAQEPAEEEVPTPPVEAPAPPVPPTPPVTNTHPGADIKRIHTCVEAVTRRLFMHVMTKCGFNTDGKFNNPAAVLEPINIADIPDANELFCFMDTRDANGVYTGNVPCNGFLKGLTTLDLNPQYRFYINMGGKLHCRSLLPQNPDKIDENSGELTNWAEGARNGDKIMHLNEKGYGTRASIKLDQGKSFGQETFKIWPPKKEKTS